MQKLLQSKYRAFLVFLIIFPWVLIALTRHPIDFGIFSDTVNGWLSGQLHLYDGQTEFYFVPWTIIALTPFVVIPQPLGLFLYLTIILAALVWATWTLTKPSPWWALAVALINLYTALLIFNGQWDSIVLASLALGWIAVETGNPWFLGLALIGMATKPPNILIPALLLIINIRKWSLPKIGKAAIIPLLAILSSFFIAGWNWPLQYISNYREHPNPPNYVVMTPWRNTLFLRAYWEYLQPFGRILLAVFLLIALVLLFRMARRNMDKKIIAVALAVNIVGSPHALLYSFTFLAPMHAILLNERRGWGIAMAGFALVDLIAVWLGWGIYIYPLVMLLVIMMLEIIDHPLRPAISSGR